MIRVMRSSGESTELRISCGGIIRPVRTATQLAHIEDVPPFARRIRTSDRDGLLGAVALAVTDHGGSDDLATLPDAPPADGTNLRMEIVYATYRVNSVAILS